MIESGDGPCLAVESFDEARIRGEFGGQHLQSDLPPQVDVFGKVHLAHSAHADLVEDAVGAEAEAFVLALQNEASLEGREDSRLHEPRCGIVGTRWQRPGLLQEHLEDVVVRQFAFANEIENGIASERALGHVRPIFESSSPDERFLGCLTSLSQRSPFAEMKKRGRSFAS
jgi:hypothetical protein